MSDVRKSVVRLVTLGLAVGLFSTVLIPAQAQVGTQVTLNNKQKAKQSRPRRETNASREARIQRTIEDTYSHRYEVFGGGGFLRFRSGSVTKRNNEISWTTAGNYYFNPKFFVVGSAQGSFGNAKPIYFSDFPQSANPQINEYFFTGGAGYRFYRKEKFALSVQGQGGVGWGIFSGGDKGVPSTDLGMWKDGVRPAFSASLNAEYNFYPNLAFRFSPTWIATTFSPASTVSSNGVQVSVPPSSIQSNLGFNAGLVYRFGRQK